MRTSQIKLIALIALAAVACFTACKKEEKHTPTCDGSSVTYDNFMQAFINSNCSGGSCHSIGSGNPTFSSYATLQPFLDNGKFEREVLTQQTMPENATLSNEELNKIQCWVDDGYPEN